nr:MAG TPA: hypothetical protein [Caudoviricetes sp.]
MPREKYMPFYEERGKKAIFHGTLSLLLFIFYGKE